MQQNWEDVTFHAYLRAPQLLSLAASTDTTFEADTLEINVSG
jgi:hypothetical protein